MRKIVLRLWKDEEGPTAVEYALMLFMLVFGLVAATTSLRQQVIAVFNQATAAIGG